jgi:Gly-Xaa carboxypeptidase
MEKPSLPVTVRHSTRPTSTNGRRQIVFLVIIAVTIWCGVPFLPTISDITSRITARPHVSSTQKHQQCEQVPTLWPAAAGDKLQQAYDFLFTPAFENASIARLSAAVQIPTESFDDLGPIGDDKRWDVFYNFHHYLNATFPRVHAQLEVEKVNTHGLLYTWHGSDAGKKPVILMAHQDVVPVDPDTLDSWTHPPWSGYFDGKEIWGRGASDCKNQLVGLMETVETLLQADYQPQRTIILSFGFDEESSGHEGAEQLSQFLLKRYGENGIAAIVDEGMGYDKAFGRGFALPAVAEKGAVDVNVAVRTPGGHSSVPRDHTSIGILSEIITAIESQQYPTYLADENPYLEFLQCAAEYAPAFPKKLQKLLRGREGKKTCMKKHPDHLAVETAALLGPEVQYLMQTSQSVDIIHGGTKSNAMPETAVALVNHRINIGDDLDTILHHLTQVVAPIAKKHNLTLHAFDGEPSAYNAISLSHDTATPVAPITPTDISRVTPYAILAGSIRALHGEDTIVAPALMTGNTDTRYYWALTKHIFRIDPGMINEDEFGVGHIHTVDERVTASNHFQTVRWFMLFLRNVAEAELDVD